MAFIPWSLWALSQRQLFSKKDGKTNNVVVDMAVMSLENGGKVEKKWLDPLLSNATSRIHDNGVVELRYASGLRSYSVAGKEPKSRFKQAGALFPKGWIKEEIGGTEITHVQTRPILDRISKAYRKYLPLKYTMKFELEMSLIEQLDQFLLEMILSGSPDDLAYMLKEYPHKVSVESPSGRTVYLKLDNPIDDGVSVLRFKGVMPKLNILGRFVTHLTSDRNILMTERGPVLEKSVNYTTPTGAMLLKSAIREFRVAEHMDDDVPLGAGEYKKSFLGEKVGFIIYGMQGEDFRIMCAGRNNFVRNNQTNEIEPLGNDGPKFYRMAGEKLRGMHDVGLIHRAFHLGNIGLRKDGNEITPVFKDFEDSFRLPISMDLKERAGWMFCDVSWPITQWSRAIEPGIESENYVRQFLEGYFGGYVSKEVIFECSTKEFSKKMDSMVDHPLLIEREFPNLYKAILAKDLADWIDFGLDGLENQLLVIRAMENYS